MRAFLLQKNRFGAHNRTHEKYYIPSECSLPDDQDCLGLLLLW